MGDHVSAFDTVKSLVTFSPSRKEVQRTYTTGTYQGGAPVDSFGPNGNRLANWSDVASGEKLERLVKRHHGNRRRPDRIASGSLLAMEGHPVRRQQWLT